MPITGVFCVVVVVIAILLSRAGPGIDVPLEVAKGLIPLAVALLITGALSYILSEQSRMQADRAEQERLLVSALQELKSAHEKVQIVQFWLKADTSPIQLREQIEVLIEVRAPTAHVRHERIIREDIEDYGPIKLMSNYIRTLDWARNMRGTSTVYWA
jgi:hypothetical protein